MPHLNAEQKEKTRLYGAQTPGQLNWAITEVILRYWNRDFQQSYTTINDIFGALEGAKLEFTRQVVNKYEDKKIAENGNVYEKAKI